MAHLQNNIDEASEAERKAKAELDRVKVYYNRKYCVNGQGSL